MKSKIINFKSLFLILSFWIGAASLLQAQDPFVTTWQTTSDNETITIPVNSHPNLYYDYDVDWGDGSQDFGVTGDITHSYNTAGIYEVEISGTFPAIYFNGNAVSREKIMTIESWGDIEWETMENAFDGCSNLTYTGENTAADAPDLTDVTIMYTMFKGASSFDADLSNWDVSNVTNMHGMFNNASSFNQNLGDWDISNVTDMNGMLKDSGLSGENYDNTLIGWANQVVQPNVLLGARGLTYCNGKTARNTLTDSNGNGWTIVQDALLCCGDQTPTGVSVSVNSLTNIIVSWDFAGLPDAGGYQVWYREVGTTTWKIKHRYINNGFGGVCNIALDYDPNDLTLPPTLGVTPDKDYEFRVRALCGNESFSPFSTTVAYDAVELSGFSALQQFTTPPMCSTPEGVASIYLDNTRMRIRWDVNPNELKYHLLKVGGLNLLATKSRLLY